MINVSYDKEFVFHDGKRAKSLAELLINIEKISDADFSQFVNPYKNDFANWINDVIMDYDLALKLRKTLSKDETIYIITTHLSSVIANSVEKSVDVTTIKPQVKTNKSSGIMAGLFKKKENKEDGHIDAVAEGKMVKADNSEISKPEIRKILFEPEKKVEHHNIAYQKPIAHQDKHLIEEGSSESVLWTLLYGLVIGLILILIMYRFVF
jgi:hypothetical protein